MLIERQSQDISYRHLFIKEEGKMSSSIFQRQPLFQAE